MSRLEGRSFGKDFRTLFVNTSPESLKAKEVLTQNDVQFSPAEVSPNSVEFADDDLPLLITGEGQWRGLSKIETYVQYCVRQRNRLLAGV